MVWVVATVGTMLLAWADNFTTTLIAFVIWAMGSMAVRHTTLVPPSYHPRTTIVHTIVPPSYHPRTTIVHTIVPPSYTPSSPPPSHQCDGDHGGTAFTHSPPSPYPPNSLPLPTRVLPPSLPPPSLTLSLLLSPSRPFALSLASSLALSLPPLTPSLPRPLALSPTLSLSHSLTLSHSPTHFLTLSHTHARAHTRTSTRSLTWGSGSMMAQRHLCRSRCPAPRRH